MADKPATLSKRQQELMDFIFSFRSKHGYSPTLQEMAEKFDLSRTSIAEHMKALYDKNMLVRVAESGRSRGYVPAAESLVSLSEAVGSVNNAFRGKEPTDRIGDIPQRIVAGLGRLSSRYAVKK